MIGLPMLRGFVGEFLILSSTFTGVSRGGAVSAALGVILGAAYMLWLVQRIFYGQQALAASKPAADLKFGELAILYASHCPRARSRRCSSLWLYDSGRRHPPHFGVRTNMSSGGFMRRRPTAQHCPIPIMQSGSVQSRGQR